MRNILMFAALSALVFTMSVFPINQAKGGKFGIAVKAPWLNHITRSQKGLPSTWAFDDLNPGCDPVKDTGSHVFTIYKVSSSKAQQANDWSPSGNGLWYYKNSSYWNYLGDSTGTTPDGMVLVDIRPSDAKWSYAPWYGSFYGKIKASILPTGFKIVGSDSITIENVDDTGSITVTDTVKPTIIPFIQTMGGFPTVGSTDTVKFSIVDNMIWVSKVRYSVSYNNGTTWITKDSIVATTDSLYWEFGNAQTFNSGTPDSASLSIFENVNSLGDPEYFKGMFHAGFSGLAGYLKFCFTAERSGQFKERIELYDLCGNIKTWTSSTVTVTDPVNPTLSVNFPFPGITTYPGCVQPVTWAASDNAGCQYVSIKFSKDGGATYLNIDSINVEGGTNSYAMTLASNWAGSDCKVKVTVYDYAGNKAEVIRSFIVQDTLKPSVTTEIPATATAGSSVTLTWTATDNVALKSVVVKADGVTIDSTGASRSSSINWTPASTGSIVISITATDAYDNVTTTQSTVTVEAATGILVPHVATPAIFGLKVISRNQFQVSMNDNQITSLRIFNLKGRVVMAQMLSKAGSYSVAPKIASGVYLVSLKKSTAVIKERFIVK